MKDNNYDMHLFLKMYFVICRCMNIACSSLVRILAWDLEHLFIAGSTSPKSYSETLELIKCMADNDYDDSNKNLRFQIHFPFFSVAVEQDALLNHS